MKYIILILFLPIICFSQNAYHFEYDVRLNSLERKAHLNISKESTSFYYEVSEKSSSKNKKSENDGNYEIQVVLGSNKKKERYQIYEQKKDTILNIDYLNDDIIYYYDKLPTQNWVVTTETKKISKYLCNKAELSFRGRNYIAWFTTDINVRYGPWKFINTPGLIMQIYDESKSFFWSINKIETIKQFNELSINNDSEIISLKEFTEKKEKSNLEMVNRSMLRYQERGLELAKTEINRGREKTFEWEIEETKKD
jgi:GLPGLI family protein